MPKKKTALTIEERLQQALVPAEEQPYELPENWVWCRLNAVAEWGSGGTPSRKHVDYYNGNIPWIKTGELNNGFIYETEEKITEVGLKNSSAKLFPVNTVLIAMYGATIGKTAILGVAATTNQACACAVCKTNLRYMYLFYYCISQKDAFIDKGKGGAQPNISQIILKQYPIPLPPLAEQQRIVDRIEELFAKLDEAKEKLQEVVDSFAVRKAAILHRAFTGELTQKWRKENGVEFSSWEEKSIKDVIKLLSGQDFPPAKYNSDKIGIPYITGASNFDGSHVLLNRWTNEPSVIAKEQDVLLVCKGSGYGKTIIADFKEAHIARQIMALRPMKAIDNNWLLYYIQNNNRYIKEQGQGLIPGLSRKVILELLINLPPLPEQHEIVRLIDKLLAQERKAQQAAEQALASIELMKKAILAKAFRGELGTNKASEASAVELLRQVLAEEK